ncbi:MAG: phosphatidylserine decarboxylase family protein [candidate division Zixibacteria bacterium]|nr:phosphatidylserine decarboxylase family protein [candidate division Zixibacteria bacterium]
MIAREGIPFIAVGLVLTVLLIVLATRMDSRWLFAFTLITAVLTVFTTFFFRDPPRSFTRGPNILLAPADGRIVSIDSLEHHPYTGGKALKVSIFLSIFDVHVNRIPAAGTVEYVRYNPGKFLAAYVDKASEVNEQTEIGIVTSGGEKIVVKQIAGLIARRIVCRLTHGAKVSAGDRFGMIRFGSRADLIVPAASEIRVKQGEHVLGGQTIIGYLKGSPADSESHEATEEGHVQI